MVSDFLKKRSQLLIEQLQSKEKRRPKSSNFARSKANTQFTAFDTKFSRQSSLSKMKKEGETSLKYTQNNSLKYLQRHKER